MNRWSRLAMGIILLCTVSARGEHPSGIEISGNVHFPNDGIRAAGLRVVFFDLTDLRNSFSGTTDREGRFHLILNPSASSEYSQPEIFHLLQNYPNPFNPSTTLPYQLQQSGHVRLEVFNMLGQRMRTLVDGVQPAGFHQVNWNAKDDQGNGVAAGVYIYRIEVEGAVETRRMLLLDGQASGAVSSGGRLASPETTVSGTESGEVKLYGVSISGQGIITYVEPEVVVHRGMGPLSFTVDPLGEIGSAKVMQSGQL